ncbi:MAG: site-specific DNA-methyltransferase, partial [Gemmatimonadetes bacterium]|nr:site-specific DNA-methyltransferase [Gemmatimonadota bacterium]
SGTSAYVAEQWARRWITCDTSRVPLALARQRLLTATFPFHQLKEPSRGPAGGFVYKRKQNKKGEEVGGIASHTTSSSIANDEPPKEEVLVDRPEADRSITRVTGPFCVEATIPTPVDWEGDGEEDSGVAETSEKHAGFAERMLEVLRRSPVLHLGGGDTIELRNIRLPARTLSLSAEAEIGSSCTESRSAEEDPTPIAIVFGPENGAVSEKLIYEAAREAVAKSYTHLYAIGFAIESKARQLIEQCEPAIGIAATYVQATPDLMMGDLLKNMRSSQIFSVCGLPEARLFRSTEADAEGLYQVELLGLDVFDPANVTTDHRRGDDVPAWLLDTDYDGMVFHVRQAFFPRTSAWSALKRALKTEFEDSVWEHLSGTLSAPFAPGDHGRVAIKVLDDRGNELMLELAMEEAVEEVER